MEWRGRRTSHTTETSIGALFVLIHSPYLQLIRNIKSIALKSYQSQGGEGLGWGGGRGRREKGKGRGKGRGKKKKNRLWNYPKHFTRVN